MQAEEFASLRFSSLICCCLGEREADEKRERRTRDTEHEKTNGRRVDEDMSILAWMKTTEQELRDGPNGIGASHDNDKTTRKPHSRT